MDNLKIILTRTYTCTHIYLVVTAEGGKSEG